MWSFPGDLCSTKLSSTLIRSCFWNATLRVPSAWDFWIHFFRYRFEASKLDSRGETCFGTTRRSKILECLVASWIKWPGFFSSSDMKRDSDEFLNAARAWGPFTKTTWGGYFWSLFLNLQLMVWYFVRYIKVFESKKHGRGAVKF